MSTKIVSISLPLELGKRFNNYCASNYINKSQLVAKLLERHLDEQDKSKNLPTNKS